MLRNLARRGHSEPVIRHFGASEEVEVGVPRRAPGVPEEVSRWSSSEEAEEEEEGEAEGDEGKRDGIERLFRRRRKRAESSATTKSNAAASEASGASYTRSEMDWS